MGKARHNTIQFGLLSGTVAFFSAGIGIGGGTLLVSYLVSIAGFNYRQAASTSLAVIIPITAVGASSRLLIPGSSYLHLFYPFFLLACIGGVLVGTRYLNRFDGKYLKLIFAVFLFIAGLKMLGVHEVTQFAFSWSHDLASSQYGIYVSCVLFGIICGFASVSLGIGCGLLIVPFFVLAVRLNIHSAIFLSLVTMFVLSVFGSIAHKKIRVSDLNILRIMIIPALIGALLGTYFSSQLPADFLKIIFGSFLLFISVIYVLNFVKSHFRPEHGAAIVER